MLNSSNVPYHTTWGEIGYDLAQLGDWTMHQSCELLPGREHSKRLFRARICHLLPSQYIFPIFMSIKMVNFK